MEEELGREDVEEVEDGERDEDEGGKGRRW